MALKCRAGKCGIKIAGMDNAEWEMKHLDISK